MGLCWCDSGTGSLLCYGFGTGIWQAYESTPLAVTAVNRHQSSTSSLESLSTSKYPQLRLPRARALRSRSSRSEEVTYGISVRRASNERHTGAMQTGLAVA